MLVTKQVFSALRMAQIAVNSLSQILQFKGVLKQSPTQILQSERETPSNTYAERLELVGEVSSLLDLSP